MKYDYHFDINGDTAPAYIAKRIKKNSRVLEFGTAHGILTKYLKEELNCSVFGVEIDEECAQIAKKYADGFYVGDIESYKWLELLSGERFDYIIFADVLEHLYNPLDVLQKVKTLLNKDGSILVSLPNVAHNVIIMELLDDSFEYRRTGLLDNTHIRFFTKKSINDFVKRAGLSISYETGVYIPPSLTEFKRNYSSIATELSKKLRKRFFGEVYQFVLELRDNDCETVSKYRKEYLARLSLDLGFGFNKDNIVTINSENQSNYLFSIPNSQKTKAIHIYLEESLENFLVKELKVNGQKLTAYTTNAESYEDFLHVVDDYFELYLPFAEPVEIKEVELNLTNMPEKIVTMRDLINKKNEEIERISRELIEIENKGFKLPNWHSLFNAVKDLIRKN